MLLVKDGARWKDTNGAPTCNFPPYSLINSLPKDVHSAFNGKAIAHSDEYYQAFVDTLLPRLKMQPVAATEDAAAVRGGGGAEHTKPSVSIHAGANLGAGGPGQLQVAGAQQPPSIAGESRIPSKVRP